MPCEIIDCYFCWNTTAKRKLKNCFLDAQTGIQVSQTAWICHWYWISTDWGTNNFMKVTSILGKDAVFFLTSQYDHYVCWYQILLILILFLVVYCQKNNQKRIKICNIFLSFMSFTPFHNFAGLGCLLKIDTAKLCRNVTIFTQNILSFFFCKKYSFQNSHEMKISNLAESPSTVFSSGKRYLRTFFVGHQ